MSAFVISSELLVSLFTSSACVESSSKPESVDCSEEDEELSAVSSVLVSLEEISSTNENRYK